MQPLSRVKSLDGPRVHVISVVEKESLWRKGFAEEPSLEFRMKYWASKRRCKRW